jgi:hypothetical protein
MVIGDVLLAVHRDGNGDGQSLRQFDQFFSSVRGRYAPSGDKDRPLGRREQRHRLLDIVWIGSGPIGWKAGELFFHEDLEVAISLYLLAQPAGQLQMHWAWGPGRGRPERLAQEVRQPIGSLHHRVHLCDRGKHWEVFHNLVEVWYRESGCGPPLTAITGEQA